MVATNIRQFQISKFKQISPKHLREFAVQLPRFLFADLSLRTLGRF